MKRERLTIRLAADGRGKKKQEVEGRETSGFSYDTSKAKTLKKSLHNINVSLGTLIAALKDIALIRGSELTPDGKLGGRGFIMSFKDIKMMLTEAVSNLSDITDTIADELTNPQWGLSKIEIKKVKKEKEKVEEKAEDIKEKEEDIKEKEEDSEKENRKEEVVLEGEEEVESSTIQTKDVKDSVETESLKRYKELITGSTDDRTNKTLSKSILANLLRGDR